MEKVVEVIELELSPIATRPGQFGFCLSIYYGQGVENMLSCAPVQFPSFSLTPCPARPQLWLGFSGGAGVGGLKGE